MLQRTRREEDLHGKAERSSFVLEAEVEIGAIDVASYGGLVSTELFGICTVQL
ncbi:hypothetical protein MAPG_09236 [Magnaporthiopsis poae ATCC 64411]|uniref:Uncharacterized protein n=1 Tax=Magnaporthiopsis poae (strain ATCC 64411 / 73-15) TaxID=644358 RepID=A0A0C4E9F2_MAGP6|nr:hypothetical protein MAPG_09236 [Magnaporthiopsis poae ATCC 64411]